jgi:hypothetical protein
VKVQKVMSGHRVTLPSRFKAGELVIVEEGKGGSVRIIPAKAIPTATSKEEARA